MTRISNQELAQAASGDRQSDYILPSEVDAGVVPLEQLKAEQDRIASALTAAETVVAQGQHSRETLQAGLERALTILGDYGKRYAEFQIPYLLPFEDR